MTLEFSSISKNTLDQLIDSVEKTLAETESSNDMLEYAGATGKCRGTLTAVLCVLYAYADDREFSLN